jgi:hypothetical protein
MQNRVGASLFAVSIASVLLAKVVAPFFKTKTNPHQKRISCISAPGKVLIAGGYLVLEHPNLGISIATTSRFYTTVQPKLLKEGVPTYANCITIIVDSPQFYEQYTYIYNIVTHSVTAIGKEHKNEFVEKCISLTMAFISQFKQKDGSGMGAIVQALNGTHYLSILLQAHNDFYSQIKEVCSLLAVYQASGCVIYITTSGCDDMQLKRRNLPLLTSSLMKLPKFLPCPKGIQLSCGVLCCHALS